MKDESRETQILQYRHDYMKFTQAELASDYKSIPRVCAASEYYRNMAKERVFSHYNGVAVVKITGFGTSLEVKKAKKRVLPFARSPSRTLSEQTRKKCVLLGTSERKTQNEHNDHNISRAHYLLIYIN